MASKPNLSSRLMGLKFMQRAKEKEVKQQAEEQAQEQDAEAHWVVEGVRTRCVVIAEGDPPPGATSSGGGTAGRMSFGGFIAQTDQLQAATGKGNQQVAAVAAEAANPGGKSVSDEAMAASLQQQQQHHHHRSGKKHERGWHRDGDCDGSLGGKKHQRGDDERGKKPKQQRARYF